MDYVSGFGPHGSHRLEVTGDVLDSMSVRGTLRYAETLEKPKDPISIMLYSPSDSLKSSLILLAIANNEAFTSSSNIPSANPYITSKSPVLNSP